MRKMNRACMHALEKRELLALTIQINYDFDANGFFSDQGRRDILQAAANDIVSRFDDDLAAISPSGPNTWAANFMDPATGNTHKMPNLNVPADTLILFAGGRDLPGNTTGFGGPGWWSDLPSAPPSTTAWWDLVRARGQTGALATPQTDFGPWGGSITFDTLFDRWFFGLDPSGLGPNGADFYSVAQHEIGHALGFLQGNESWDRWVSGTNFTGPNATAAYGGPVPIKSDGHWADGVKFNGGPVVMDPVSENGKRITFTRLDFAAMADIGWEVSDQVPVPTEPPGGAAPRDGFASISHVIKVSSPDHFTDDIPYIEDFNGRRYRASTDAEQDLYLEMFDRSLGTYGNRVTFNEKALFFAGLAVQDNQLHIAWATPGTGRLNLAVVTTSAATGTPVALVQKETLNHTSEVPPVLSEHKGALVLAWAGTDTHLYFDLKDPVGKHNWSPSGFDSGHYSEFTPSLTHWLDGEFYVGWRGLDDAPNVATIAFEVVNGFAKQSFPLSGSGTLTINGDQRGVEYNDIVSVERAASGGVKVTFNDEIVEYPGGGDQRTGDQHGARTEHRPYSRRASRSSAEDQWRRYGPFDSRRESAARRLYVFAQWIVRLRNLECRRLHHLACRCRIR
jgi:hypothetical protein